LKIAMRLTPRSYPKFSAFTLIELIMTIIVIGIIAIPLSLLVSQHIESIFQSEDLTIGANLVRFEMEVVNNMNYTNIVNATFNQYQGYNYNVTRSVSYAHGSGVSSESTKKVTVEVSKIGQTNVIVGLVTYITRNINYPY
jgi:prepilin-type N-terminal cleavage/methylation domain-containing protein